MVVVVLEDALGEGIEGGSLWKVVTAVGDQLG